jgi:hypothetical protein
MPSIGIAARKRSRKREVMYDHADAEIVGEGSAPANSSGAGRRDCA